MVNYIYILPPIFTVGEIFAFIIFAFLGVKVNGKLILSIPILISLDLIITNIIIASKEKKELIFFLIRKILITLWLLSIVFFILIGKVIIPIIIFSCGVTAAIFYICYYLTEEKINKFLENEPSENYDSFLPLEVFLITAFCFILNFLFQNVFVYNFIIDFYYKITILPLPYNEEPIIFFINSLILTIPNILIIVLRNQNIKNSLVLVLTPIIVSLCKYSYEIGMFSDIRRYGHYEFNINFYKHISKEDIILWILGIIILLFPQIISNIINYIRNKIN